MFDERLRIANKADADLHVHERMQHMVSLAQEHIDRTRSVLFSQRVGNIASRAKRSILWLTPLLVTKQEAQPTLTELLQEITVLAEQLESFSDDSEGASRAAEQLETKMQQFLAVLEYAGMHSSQDTLDVAAKLSTLFQYFSVLFEWQQQTNAPFEELLTRLRERALDVQQSLENNAPDDMKHALTQEGFSHS